MSISAANLLPEIARAAREAALDHGLPYAIVAGIVCIESEGNSYAHRFEPGYIYCWNVGSNTPFRATRGQAASNTAPSGFRGGVFTDQAGAVVRISATSEWNAQRTSWGLMQLMGANARSYGFRGPLPELCRPETGLHYACIHLARLRDRWLDAHGWRGVVDAFNDGTWAVELAEDYPDLVAKTSPEAAQLLKEAA